MSTRQIAEVTGASHTTIERDLTGTNVPSSGTNVPVKDEVMADGPVSQTVRQLLSQSDQNDWRTPRKFLDSARAVTRITTAGPRGAFQDELCISR
jgi:hypothetical protein